MAISYAVIRKLVADQAFQDRLQVALWREASKLLRQTPAPSAELLTWARAALKGVSQNMTEATIRVATTGAVFNQGDAVTDDQLQAVVGTIVADLAGAPCPWFRLSALPRTWSAPRRARCWSASTWSRPSRA